MACKLLNLLAEMWISFGVRLPHGIGIVFQYFRVWNHNSKFNFLELTMVAAIAMAMVVVEVAEEVAVAVAVLAVVVAAAAAAGWW